MVLLRYLLLTHGTPNWAPSRFIEQFLEGVLQTRSWGVIGARVLHAVRANLRNMSLLIAP